MVAPPYSGPLQTESTFRRLCPGARAGLGADGTPGCGVRQSCVQSLL